MARRRRILSPGGRGGSFHTDQEPAPKPGPVPDDQPILAPELEAKLRAAGLRITGLTMTHDDIPASIVFTDTQGELHGLSDLKAFADSAAERTPNASVLGGALAEFFLALREPDKGVRLGRIARNASVSILKDHEKAKGGPAQGEQAAVETPDDSVVKPATCWFGGHDKCTTCGRCRRPACILKDHCTCKTS